MPSKSGTHSIAIAAVAHDEHDRRVAHLARDAKCHGARAARRYAAENAFVARETAHGLLGIRLRDGLDPVDALGVEDPRQVRLGPLADPRYRRAFRGLRAHDGNGGILFLEEAR